MLENIYSRVNFCGKMSAVVFICGNLFLQIAGKIAKIGKIRTRQNFVPHGTAVCTLNLNPCDVLMMQKLTKRKSRAAIIILRKVKIFYHNLTIFLKKDTFFSSNFCS